MISSRAVRLKAAVGAGLLIVLGWCLLGGSRGAAHFANADDRDATARGKLVYMARCASCHGRYLQGQPLWQLVDGLSAGRAPAHDQTGHTWLHSDDDLFSMTKFGHFPDVPVPDVPDTAGSAMPAFKEVLDDDEIVAVIAFIKARWPIGLRVLQATRNPGRAGLPEGAKQAEWTFPPDCVAATQRAKVVEAARR